MRIVSPSGGENVYESTIKKSSGVIMDEIKMIFHFPLRCDIIR